MLNLPILIMASATAGRFTRSEQKLRPDLIAAEQEHERLKVLNPVVVFMFRQASWSPPSSISDSSGARMENEK
jgi:hypothetical protein